MSASIIKSFAVAALLSTTLINGTVACDVDAVELTDTTKGIGKVLHSLRDYDLTAHPEIAPLLAKVDKAISDTAPLHSSLTKDSLQWIINSLDSLYFAIDEKETADEAEARRKLVFYNCPTDIADIFDAPGGASGGPAPTILTAAETAHRAFMLTLSSGTSTDIYVPHYETGAPTAKLRGLNKADRAIIDSFDSSTHTEADIKRIQAAHEAALLNLDKTRALENEKAVAYLRSQLAKSTPAPSSASGSSTSGMDVATAQKMVTAAKFSSSEVRKGLGRNPITTEDWLNGALVFASKAVDEKTDLEIAISDLETELANAKAEILVLRK